MPRNKPIGRGQAQKIEPLFNIILDSLLKKYYEYLTKERPGDAEPQVRANLMLPTKKHRFPWGSYLKIYGASCPPPNIQYSADERRLTWRKGEGTCGWVWVDKEEALYDSKENRYKSAAGRLTEEQRSLVSRLNSVYSIPVWKNNEKIVGVLTLDSPANISDTIFDHGEVKRICEEHAERLGIICPYSGVYHE